MWRRLIAQIRKEMLSVLRDPRSRVVLVGPPIVQLFIFAFAATLEVENVSVAVLNQDSGQWSRELVERIRATRLAGDVIVVDSTAAFGEAIDGRRALLGIAFQPEFSRRIESGATGVAQVVLDGRRGNSAQIALGYLNTIVSELNDELAERRRGSAWVEEPARARAEEPVRARAEEPMRARAEEPMRARAEEPMRARAEEPMRARSVELVSGHAEAPVRTVVRHWFNPNLEYLWFTVPALVGILSMFSALIITALSIARERELGTFEQLLVSPATPAEIIAGKCIPALILGTVLASVMIAAGIFAYRIPFTGSAALLYGALLLFILSVVGVGLMISSISRTQQQAILGAFAVGVPLVLLSGFATPVENMPPALQAVAEANPLQHFLVIVQGLFLKALPPEVVWSSLWPIGVIAAVTLTAAFVVVRGRLQ